MVDTEWALPLSDSEEEDSVHRDPDWVKTPRFSKQTRRPKADNSGQVKVLGIENVTGC